MSSTPRPPRAAPRNRSGPPAQPSAATLARSAKAHKSAATRARNDPWTRVQDSKLLKAYIQNKTGQALADAVGGGRTPDECTERLHSKSGGLVPKRLFLVYEWNPAEPHKHSAVFRAKLTEEQRNMQAPQLEQLWLQESKATCEKAVGCVINCGLDAGWNTVPNCAEILSKMGLHPDFLQQRLKRRLTKTFTDRRKALLGAAEATRTHRETCMKRLAAETKVNLADLNDDDFQRRDKRAYDHLRRLAACADALADDADAETQMPTGAEVPEISQRTVKPPFEPVPVDARLSNPAFARPFRRHDQKFRFEYWTIGLHVPVTSASNPSGAARVVAETLRRDHL